MVRLAIEGVLTSKGSVEGSRRGVPGSDPFYISYHLSYIQNLIPSTLGSQPIYVPYGGPKLPSEIPILILESMEISKTSGQLDNWITGHLDNAHGEEYPKKSKKYKKKSGITVWS